MTEIPTIFHALHWTVSFTKWEHSKALFFHHSIELPITCSIIALWSCSLIGRGWSWINFPESPMSYACEQHCGKRIAGNSEQVCKPILILFAILLATNSTISTSRQTISSIWGQINLVLPHVFFGVGRQI